MTLARDVSLTPGELPFELVLCIWRVCSRQSPSANVADRSHRKLAVHVLDTGGRLSGCHRGHCLESPLVGCAAVCRKSSRARAPLPCAPLPHAALQVMAVITYGVPMVGSTVPGP